MKYLCLTPLVLTLAACGGHATSESGEVPTVDGWRIYDDQYQLETSEMRSEPSTNERVPAEAKSSDARASVD